MPRQNANTEQIEGRIYQQNLQMKQVSNKESKNFGKDFINGFIEVDTSDDEKKPNILTIHYTYVTSTTSKGQENRTFTTLKRIMDEDRSIVTVGRDKAWKVRCNPSIALNDFYPQGRNDVVSTPRNEGGFVTIVNELAPDGIDRKKFTADALITHVNREDDDEEGVRATVKCAIFNFRNDILPFTFTLRNEDAIQYFEDLNVSNQEPIFTKVWGEIDNRTEIIKEEIESAFGQPAVDVKQRRIREWVITGAAREPYPFGEGGVLTPEEVQKAVENRNVMLAETKKRSEDYYASRNNTGSIGNTVNQIPKGGFDF